MAFLVENKRQELFHKPKKAIQKVVHVVYVSARSRNNLFFKMACLPTGLILALTRTPLLNRKDNPFQCIPWIRHTNAYIDFFSIQLPSEIPAVVTNNNTVPWHTTRSTIYRPPWDSSHSKTPNTCIYTFKYRTCPYRSLEAYWSLGILLFPERTRSKMGSSAFLNFVQQKVDETDLGGWCLVSKRRIGPIMFFSRNKQKHWLG